MKPRHPRVDDLIAKRLAGSICTLAPSLEPRASSATLAAGALLAAVSFKMADASAADTAAWLDRVCAELMTQALTGG